jgi:hypothetical protein
MYAPGGGKAIHSGGYLKKEFRIYLDVGTYAFIITCMLTVK